MRRFGLAAAAVVGVQHDVGEYPGDPGVNGRRPVNPGQSGEAGGRRTDASVRGEIGADGNLGVGAQPEKPVLAVEGQLRVDQAAAPLIVRQQALRALGDPLDRPSDDLGGPKPQRVLGLAAAPGAEAAAHIVADDPELRLRLAEDVLGQHPPDAMNRLHRRPQGVAVLERVVLGDTAAIFHGIAGDAVDADPMADDMGRLGERRIDRRRIAEFVEERLVAGIVRPNGRRVRVERPVDADDDRQRGVLDMDQFGGVLGLVHRFGDDERHPPARRTAHGPARAEAAACRNRASRRFAWPDP